MADHFTCSICLEFASDSPSTDYFVSTPGGHIFHYLCIKQYLENGRGEEGCPLCREPLVNLTRLYGIKLKKTELTVRLQSDGGDGTLPSMKIVLLGSSTVGKTSLIRCISNQRFVSSSQATIGCDVAFRNIQVGGKLWRMNLWDTAGQENFKSIVSTTVRSSQALIFVYDVTEPQSLNDIEAWADFATKYAPEDCVRVLVGNKTDLGGRTVSRMVGEAVGEKMGMPHYETSAKSGHNVEPLFKSVVGLILEKPVKNMAHVVELELESGSGRRCAC